MTTRNTITVTAILLLTSPALAQTALPYPKGSGQCAGSYVQSGGFCVPKSDRSPPAIPKIGACPSGWRQSGSTCERMR